MQIYSEKINIAKKEYGAKRQKLAHSNYDRNQQANTSFEGNQALGLTDKLVHTHTDDIYYTYVHDI